jgi:hypothetical protein
MADNKPTELTESILHGAAARTVRSLSVEEIDKLISDGRELNIHPLGFLHVKLADIASVGQLRLHIWLRGTRYVQNPPWTIHRHTKNLHSHVLTGEIVNRIYEVSKHGEPQTNKLYGVEYESGSSVLVDLEEGVTCSTTSRVKYAAPSSYSVRYDQYHSSDVPEDQFTVTMAVFAEGRQTETRVVGDIDGDSEYRYERQEIGVTRSRAILQLARKEITNND